MWCYYNRCGMNFNEMFIFETEKELNKFLAMATAENMKRCPDDPEPWNMTDDEEDDDEVSICEFKVISAEQAFDKWFNN